MTVVLPEDIVEAVFDLIEVSEDLVILPLICKSWQHAGGRRLYRSIAAPEPNSADPCMQARKLRVTLEENTRLASYVRELVLDLGWETQEDLYSLLGIVRLCPSLISLELQLVPSWFREKVLQVIAGEYPVPFKSTTSPSLFSSIKNIVRAARRRKKAVAHPVCVEEPMQTSAINKLPLLKLDFGIHYFWTATMFQSLRALTSAQLEEFSGTVVGDDDTLNALLNCLMHWQNLRRLRLVLAEQHLQTVDSPWKEKFGAVLKGLPYIRSLSIRAVFIDIPTTLLLIGRVQELHCFGLTKEELIALKRAPRVGLKLSCAP